LGTGGEMYEELNTILFISAHSIRTMAQIVRCKKKSPHTTNGANYWAQGHEIKSIDKQTMNGRTVLPVDGKP